MLGAWTRHQFVHHLGTCMLRVPVSTMLARVYSDLRYFMGMTSTARLLLGRGALSVTTRLVTLDSMMP